MFLKILFSVILFGIFIGSVIAGWVPKLDQEQIKHNQIKNEMIQICPDIDSIRENHKIKLSTSRVETAIDSLNYSEISTIIKKINKLDTESINSRTLVSNLSEDKKKTYIKEHISKETYESWYIFLQNNYPDYLWLLDDIIFHSCYPYILKSYRWPGDNHFFINDKEYAYFYLLNNVKSIIDSYYNRTFYTSWSGYPIKITLLNKEWEKISEREYPSSNKSKANLFWEYEITTSFLSDIYVKYHGERISNLIWNSFYEDVKWINKSEDTNIAIDLKLKIEFLPKQ